MSVEDLKTVEDLPRYKELYNMFKFDDTTVKKIKKLNYYYRRNDNTIEYFNKLFEILHKDVLTESKNRYVEYIKKNCELKKNFKKLFKDKNEYKYDIYINLYNNIKKQMNINKKLYYGICDGLYRKIGKAKLLIDEKIYEEDFKKLDSIKQYIIDYYS